MMKNTVCYKLKNPIVYNKGTKWEKSCDTFLACYGEATQEATQRKVDKLNNNIFAKAQFCAEHKLIASSIDYFFVDSQKEFDTKGN